MGSVSSRGNSKSKNTEEGKSRTYSGHKKKFSVVEIQCIGQRKETPLGQLTSLNLTLLSRQRFLFRAVLRTVGIGVGVGPKLYEFRRFFLIVFFLMIMLSKREIINRTW